MKQLKTITTDSSNMFKNQTYLIFFCGKDKKRYKVLYKCLDYGILSMYADRTLRNEIENFDYIYKVVKIRNSFDYKAYGLNEGE